MTALAHPTEAAFAAGASPTSSLVLDLVTDFAALEPEWRALEAGGVLSPYQGFEWVRAYADALAASEGFTPVLFVLRDRAGRLALVLPLAVRRGALAVAAPIGGKHANFNLPAMAPGSPPDAATLRALLVEAGRRLDLDAFAFANLPRTWDGVANPLDHDGRPSPSDGYKLTLGPDPEEILARALSKDTRKKLRKKEKALADLGPVHHRTARDVAEVEAMLSAFFTQKEARFRDLGIADPFADPAVRRFLRDAARARLDRGEPAIALHALMAGERIVAVFGAAVDAKRCCGMMISFDADPAVARCSPGDLLLTHVVRAECAAGRTTFDLGVGEARYKSSLCEEVEELVDVFVPVSLKGRAYAAASTRLAAMKRAVKRSDRAWSLVGRMRGLKARFMSGTK